MAAAKPREPAGEPATAQERAKLLLDEPGEAVSVAQTDGLHAEGLEMIAHDLVDRALRGRARFVVRGGPHHQVPWGEPNANAGNDEIGLNPRARERKIADFAVQRV